MRFSCLGFARVVDEEGRYALLLNKEWLKKGRRVFSPIGGALQLNTLAGMQYLVKTFGASSFENGLDLRFQAPEIREAEIKKWFHSDIGRLMREASAAREVREELTDEKLVGEKKILTLGNLEGVHETFSHFCYHSGLKRDHPVPGKNMPTTYIVEVYDFMFPAAVCAKMKRHPAVYFAHESEIKWQRTYDKKEIGDISKTLLR